MDAGVEADSDSKSRMVGAPRGSSVVEVRVRARHRARAR